LSCVTLEVGRASEGASYRGRDAEGVYGNISRWEIGIHGRA